MAKKRTPAASARRTAARRDKRLLRFGTDTPSCAACGYHRRTASLQVHEPGGEANQELSMFVCRNCHDELTDAGIDSLGDLRLRIEDRDPLEIIAALLLGLVDFLQLLTDKLKEWARWCQEAGPYLQETAGPRWWEPMQVAVPL